MIWPSYDSQTNIRTYIKIWPFSLSYSTVVLYSRDQYEIIGLLKISHSMKQPCSNICLKKALEMRQKCVTMQYLC